MMEILCHVVLTILQLKAEVTVFESGKVGGRLATTQIAGHEYETGGSIIHPANREAYILNNYSFLIK